MGNPGWIDMRHALRSSGRISGVFTWEIGGKIYAGHPNKSREMIEPIPGRILKNIFILVKKKLEISITLLVNILKKFIELWNKKYWVNFREIFSRVNKKNLGRNH